MGAAVLGTLGLKGLFFQPILTRRLREDIGMTVFVDQHVVKPQRDGKNQETVVMRSVVNMSPHVFSTSIRQYDFEVRVWRVWIADALVHEILRHTVILHLRLRQRHRHRNRVDEQFRRSLRGDTILFSQNPPMRFRLCRGVPRHSRNRLDGSLFLHVRFLFCRICHDSVPFLNYWLQPY